MGTNAKSPLPRRPRLLCKCGYVFFFLYPYIGFECRYSVEIPMGPFQSFYLGSRPVCVTEFHVQQRRGGGVCHPSSIHHPCSLYYYVVHLNRAPSSVISGIGNVVHTLYTIITITLKGRAGTELGSMKARLDPSPPSSMSSAASQNNKICNLVT